MKIDPQHQVRQLQPGSLKRLCQQSWRGDTESTAYLQEPQHRQMPSAVLIGQESSIADAGRQPGNQLQPRPARSLPRPPQLLTDRTRKRFRARFLPELLCFGEVGLMTCVIHWL
jgi:hypothetical protein